MAADGGSSRGVLDPLDDSDARLWSTGPSVVGWEAAVGLDMSSTIAIFTILTTTFVSSLYRRRPRLAVATIVVYRLQADGGVG